MTDQNVLLTGTSGIAIAHVLRRLKAGARPAPRCVKAERHFLECVMETGLVTGLEWESAELAMIQALSLPRDVLLACWRTAFLRLVERQFPDFESAGTAQTTDGAGPLVLALHMCYYHQQTREFASLIDLDLLKEHVRPKIVVTLVDDVEHMFGRLRHAEHMLSHYDYGGFRGFALACKHLTQLVHWRSSEMAFGEAFARLLGCRHYVLAVKQSAATLRALLFDPVRPLAYLSHPITEPRRALAAGDRPSFDAFCKELESAAAILRGSLTLVEPTAIDEFRFRSFQVPSSPEGETHTIHLPKLGMRWPAPNHGEGALWSPVPEEDPVALCGLFPENQLKAYESAVRSTRSPRHPWRLARSFFHRRTKAYSDLENATHLVSALVGEIGRAVTARDLKLVEQCDHIVVIRPLYSGRSSNGVLQEILQHCRLFVTAKAPRRRGGVWVFTCQSDEDAWRRAQVERWLNQHYKYTRVEAEKLVRAVDTSAAPLGADGEALVVALRGLAGRLLMSLNDEAARSGGRSLLPTAKESGDHPLGAAPEVTAAVARQERTDGLLEQITPPYLQWPIWYGEKFDTVIPVTIYWADGWPQPQDLVDACQKASRATDVGGSPSCGHL